jgi:EAL domain-containing protein (putative c-di-GMP-specific phosphodiesterase class I)
MAESTGAIVPIGAWVLETACDQARRWKDRLAGRPFKVSVNLSPTQVFQEDLVQTVAGALAHSGLDPADLILELTEEVMVKDKERAAGRLRDLTAMGVELAIDDFGTGYSSLSYLQQLPFSILKIDRTFIQAITAGPEESLLASVIVDLAARMGLWTVAEGVEELDQARALYGLGCDAAQGYAFARPVAPDQIDGVIDGVTHSAVWFDGQEGTLTPIQGPALSFATEPAALAEG